MNFLINSASLGASALMRSEAQPLRYSCCVFRILSKYIVKTQGGGQRLSGPLAPLHRNGGFLGAPPPLSPLSEGKPSPFNGLHYRRTSLRGPSYSQCPSVGSTMRTPLAGWIPSPMPLSAYHIYYIVHSAIVVCLQLLILPY